MSSDECEELIRRADNAHHDPEGIALAERAMRQADLSGTFEQRLEARMILTGHATFGGAPEVALVAFTWCLSHYDEPDARAWRASILWNYKWILRSLYRFPQFGLLAMGIAAVALGLGRAAIEEMIEVAGGKIPDASRRSLAQRPNAQTEVALAEAGLRSARAFYYEAIEKAWAEALDGRISIDSKRDIRLATTHATRAAAEAVDRMYTLAGGTSVYRRSPLQRIFRDVHVATQHMMVGPATLELTGRLLLGLETSEVAL